MGIFCFGILPVVSVLFFPLRILILFLSEAITTLSKNIFPDMLVFLI